MTPMGDERKATTPTEAGAVVALAGAIEAFAERQITHLTCLRNIVLRMQIETHNCLNICLDAKLILAGHGILGTMADGIMRQLHTMEELSDTASAMMTSAAAFLEDTDKVTARSAGDGT